MKKNTMFRGWASVFRFTFQEITGKKGYYASLFIFAFILFLFVVGAFALLSDSQKEEELKPLTLKNIAVIDDTGLEYLRFGESAKISHEAAPGKTWNVTFVSETESLESKQTEMKDSKEDAVLHIEKGEGNNVSCNLFLPRQIEISSNGKDHLLEMVSKFIYRTKSVNLGIEENKLTVLTAPVMTTYSVQGEPPETTGETLLKLLTPMALIMLLYFMVLAYGQSAGKIISVEKTSKLMDTLLLSVKPYALILGKITAMSAAAVVQIIAWLLSIILGVFAGNYAGHIINPDFVNPLYEAFDLLRESGAGNAFTWGSILLGILAVILGFLFYMMIAGLVASRISKTEDLAQGMGFYQILVVAGFLISYSSVTFSPFITELCNWIPVTSAYLLPGKLMIGDFGFLHGIGVIACLTVFILASAMIAARLYRNQVFYQK